MQILGLLISVYNCLASAVFDNAIVKDQLYFNIRIFARAREIADVRIIYPDSLVMFDIKINRLRNIIKNMQQKESSNIPDTYLDHLTYEIMKGPVILLTSNVTVDRTTFDMLMMCDGIDPFNREKLSEDKIKAACNLKSKIEQYSLGK